MGVLLLSAWGSPRASPGGSRPARSWSRRLFFIEVFFASKGLLGWPGTGAVAGPASSCCGRAWSSPIPRSADRGAIYLWVEEVDENNVPSGLPRSYRLPYSRPLADRSLKARDEIMAGQSAGGRGRGACRNDGRPCHNTEQRRNAEAANLADRRRRHSQRRGNVELADQALLCEPIPRVEFRPDAGADAAAEALVSRLHARRGVAPAARSSPGTPPRSSPRPPSARAAPAWCRPAPCRDAAR